MVSLPNALNGESLREDFLVSCSAFVAIHITLHSPQSLHYGAAEGQKWQTLTNFSSMDFDHIVPKCCTSTPRLPNFRNTNIEEQNIWKCQINKKKETSWGVFDRNDWCQKNPITKSINFWKINICQKDPQVPKKWG